MATPKFTLNHAEVQSYLDGDHGVRDLLMARAERIRVAIADDPHDDSGAFENGLTIEEVHTDRMVLRVGSSDFKGHILEARYGMHARALDAAGGA